MIIGACIAARQDRIRFSRINGYGSKGLLIIAIELITIHIIKITPNIVINFQLPPKLANLSDNL
jgi:hypothetical protein